MKIAIVCYPTFGGSGVVATELGIALSKRGHEVHFITYKQPVRLDLLNEKIYNIAENYKPDLLVLGHNNILESNTIDNIKNRFKSMIIKCGRK